jgi:hypothetical protein
VDIDRMQASQNLHTTLLPVIATLDHHECAASMDPLRIGVRLIIRHTEVGECLNQMCTLIGGVPLDGCGGGGAALGVIQSEMDITARKTIRDQLLHHLLSVRARVI